MSIFRRFLRGGVLLLCLGAFSSWAEASTTLMERAKNLYEIQDYAHALRFFEKILETDSESGEVLDYAGWCHRYLGNWKKAEQVFEKALTHLPDALGKWVWVGLGETYLGAESYIKAQNAFEKALLLAPEDQELVERALKGVVFSLASLGKQDLAEERLRALAEKNSTAAEALAQEMLVLLERHKKAAVDAEADLGTPKEEPTSADVKQKIPDLLTDSDQRQQEIIAAHTPAKTAEKATIGNFALGAPIETVLTSLEQQGIAFSKLEESTRMGSSFYIVELPKGSLLPDTMPQGEHFLLYALEEFQGKLLSVGVSVIWRDQKSAISFKDALFKALQDALTASYGENSHLSDTGIYTEAHWIPDSALFVALEATAGLEGSVVATVNYNDLPGLRIFLGLEQEK